MRKRGHGALNQIGTFTRRWGQLSWLYARGDRQAACDIEALMRRVAENPGSPCTAEQVDQFASSCRQTP
jgi:hypothetical protein